MHVFGEQSVGRWLHAESSDENRHGEMAADVLLAALAKSDADQVEFRHQLPPQGRS
jgi:hypothetical protein